MQAATYDFSDLFPGARMQSTGNADRPLAAFIAGLAASVRGQPFRLIKPNGPETDVIDAVLAASDVPKERASLWIDGVNWNRVSQVTRVAISRVNGMTLSDYQRDALMCLPPAGGVLAFRMGLGKTLTAVCAALSWARRQVGHDHRRCWIVCPINAKGAWAPYLPELQAEFDDVQVISVDLAHKLDGAANTGGVLIIDEAHMLGDMKARRTQHMHALRAKFDTCYVLTGTLLHAGVAKCLSLLDLAIPGAAGFANQYTCGEALGCLLKTPHGTSVSKPTGVGKEAFLAYLSRYCVSLDKNHPDVRESADIPDQELILHRVGEPWLPLSMVGADIIRACLADGEELPHAMAVMHGLMRAGFKTKWAALMLLVEKHGPHNPWVIFAHYRETIDAAAAELDLLGASYVRIDGDTKQADRVEAVRRFQAGEVQVFLGQLTAAGVSVDLFAAQYSVTLDTSWKAIDYDQALARTCRRGQTRTCYHWDLVTNELQVAAVNRMRDAADFNAECAEYQLISSLVSKHKKAALHVSPP